MATVKLSNAINRLAIKTKNLINAIKTELQKKASMINLEENVDYTDYDTFLAKFKALGGQLGSRVRIITQTNGTYELTVVLNPATNADTFTANGQYQNNSATAPVVNIGTFIKNATNQEWKPLKQKFYGSIDSSNNKDEVYLLSPLNGKVYMASTKDENYIVSDDVLDSGYNGFLKEDPTTHEIKISKFFYGYNFYQRVTGDPNSYVWMETRYQTSNQITLGKVIETTESKVEPNWKNNTIDIKGVI